PTPLYYAAGLSARLGGAKIYFKREEMRPGNPESMFNALGQALLARFIGKRRLLCGSGAGRSATAYAAAAKTLGLRCSLFLGGGGVDAGMFDEKSGVEVVFVKPGKNGKVDPRRAAL